MSTIEIKTRRNGQKQVFVSGAKIRFRNFSGNQTAFNKAGDRNFLLMLTEEEAKLLESECDFVVKRKDFPEEENRDVEYSIRVKVKYDENPARFLAKTYTNGGIKKETTLDEKSLGILDHAEISDLDIILSPYAWHHSKLGTSGVTAYANTIHAVIEENPFEDKYSRYMQE